MFCREHGWGRVFITKRPTPYPGEPWAFDNGAFRDYSAGKDFNAGAFLRRLEIAYDVGEPLFAVLPDIIQGGEASLEFSLDWLVKLPPWPWYLAVQDGMGEGSVEQVIGNVDGLFLGGSDKFKATAGRWRALAHKHSKRFHYGRAGTPRKIIHALSMLSDSADSAFPLWTKERMKLTAHVLSQKEKQLSLTRD